MADLVLRVKNQLPFSTQSFEERVNCSYVYFFFISFFPGLCTVWSLLETKTLVQRSSLLLSAVEDEHAATVIFISSFLWFF